MQISNVARLLAATACFLAITIAVPVATAEGLATIVHFKQDELQF